MTKTKTLVKAKTRLVKNAKNHTKNVKPCSLGSKCPYRHEYQHQLEFSHDNEIENNKPVNERFPGQGHRLNQQSSSSSSLSQSSSNRMSASESIKINSMKSNTSVSKPNHSLSSQKVLNTKNNTDNNSNDSKLDDFEADLRYAIQLSLNPTTSSNFTNNNSSSATNKIDSDSTQHHNAMILDLSVSPPTKTSTITSSSKIKNAFDIVDLT